ncbi:hypothetical protein ACH46N_08050 [Streptomyces pristinaespiralis]|jgi:hypothetical protein|nr:hypothetical protein [Streptomyces pristinaespiralis]ALC23561.1 hypothetical protein SPRI_5255 [Streptomyces pristinaespiralis]QMU13980.1 hypothetical protein H3L99_10500 [Streptomyces pristinaespiralis]
MSDAAAPAYLATTDRELTDRAYDLLEAGQLTVSPHGSGDVYGFVVAGPCPRCAHHIVDRQVSVALTGTGGVGRSADADPVETVVLDVSCGCGSTHVDAPEGLTGCGASFRLELDIV